MTRYRVPVSDPLLAEKDFWRPVEGLRLISADGPWLAHPDVTICTFEDDNAPAVLEGLLIEPVISLDTETGVAAVTGRRIVRSP